MFDKNTYDKIKALWSYVKPFFHGLFWPFTWLESKAASVGLLVSMFILIAIASTVGLAVLVALDSSGSSDASGDTVSDLTSPDISDTCNAVGVEIRDCIMTYQPTDPANSASTEYCDVITSSEDVVWKLEEAANSPQIKAVVIEVDSTGGSPVAAEEIAAAIKALGKPSIAWVRGNADSAAYWIASAADSIIAAENSDIGGIGVTQSFTDNSKENQKKGITFNQLSTGLYKDTGNPDKPLTADEKTYLLRDLNIMLNNFINAVAMNRNLSVAKVTALADGSTMLGRMALKNGLIDEIGTKAKVWAELEAAIGEKPEVCWP